MTSVQHAPFAAEEIPKIPHAEAIELGRSQNEAFLRELRALSPEEWDAVTDCAPWTVHDIAVHLLSWAEAIVSPKEFYRQTKETLKVRKDWPNIVDAQNAVQVEEGRGLQRDEILARLESAYPRFIKLRDRLGPFLKPVPTYNGLLGWVSLGFISDTIFTRDVFMHRVDIATATGRSIEEGPNEARIVADCLKEWGKGSKARARVILDGAAGGDFLVGAAEDATIRASSTDFIRILGGRPRGSSVHIEGDVAAAERWLSVGCRF